MNKNRSNRCVTVPTLIVIMTILQYGCVPRESGQLSVQSSTKGLVQESELADSKKSLTDAVESVILDERFYDNLKALPDKDAAEVCRLYCDEYNFTRCRACLDTYLEGADLSAPPDRQCPDESRKNLFEILSRKAHLCLFFSDLQCAQQYTGIYEGQLAFYEKCEEDDQFEYHAGAAELYALISQGSPMAYDSGEKIDRHLQRALSLALGSGERESKKISAALKSEVLVDIALQRYAQALEKLDDPGDYLNKEYSEKVRESVESRLPLLGGLFSVISIGGDLTGTDSDDSLVASVTSSAAAIGLVGTLLEEAAAEFEKNPYRKFQIAKCSYELGKNEDSPFNDFFARAKKLYEELAEEQSEEPGKYNPEILYSDLGRVYLLQEDHEKSIRHLKQAVAISEKFRSSLNSDVDKMGFFTTDRQKTYIDLVTLLHFTGRNGEALEYAERAKSRALVDMLKNKASFGAGERQKASTALINQINRREFQLSRSFHSGEKDSQRGWPQSSDEDYADDIIQQPLASLVTVRGVSHQQIQGMLSENETLIEFFGDQANPFVFAVSNRDITVKQLHTPDLAYYVGKIRNELNKGPGENGYRRAARWLYSKLIEPVGPLIEGRDLIIVPHGVLHNLPFAALLDDDGRYFVESHSLRMLPAASILVHLGNDREVNDHILVVSDPFIEDYDFSRQYPKLEYSYSEGRSISNFFPHARHFTDRAATETVVKTFGRKVSILHISSHAKFYPENPLASRLLLAADGENDGALNVADIYDMNIDADLVTLSGCETGIGDLENGDDIIGLTRGLIFAGAKSIVTSLWSVDDRASALLMEKFYKAMLTKPRQHALRAAQLQFIEGMSEEEGLHYRHPYFWAPFYLTGTAGNAADEVKRAEGQGYRDEEVSKFLALDKETSGPPSLEGRGNSGEEAGQPSRYFAKPGARLRLVSANVQPGSSVRRGMEKNESPSPPHLVRSNVPPKDVVLPPQVKVSVRGEISSENTGEISALSGSVEIIVAHGESRDAALVTVFIRKLLDDEDLYEIPVVLKDDSNSTSVLLKRPLLGWQTGEYEVMVRKGKQPLSSITFSIVK